MKEIYKNIEIEYSNSNLGFRASGLDETFGSFNSTNQLNGRYKTKKGAELDIKAKIDEFLELTPKTYSKLAKYLTDYLTWKDWEQCYLHPFICETLVGNFLRHQLAKGVVVGGPKITRSEKSI